MDLLLVRDRGLFGEDPPWIQDPFTGRSLVDSRPPLGDELPPLVFLVFGLPKAEHLALIKINF